MEYTQTYTQTNRTDNMVQQSLGLQSHQHFISKKTIHSFLKNKAFSKQTPQKVNDKAIILKKGKLRSDGWENKKYQAFPSTVRSNQEIEKKINNDKSMQAGQ